MSDGTEIQEAHLVAARWAERLTNLLKNDGRLFLLLNRYNGLDERLQSLIDALPERWPLMDPYFGDAVHRTPMLVKITTADLPLLDHTVLLAAQTALDPTLPAGNVCSWMCADGSAVQLASQLRRQLDVRIEGREKSSYFRYFDPRVTLQLPRVLTARQWARVLGSIQLWVLPGRGGHLVELSSPDAPMAPVSWRLSAEQAQALGRVEAITASLRVLLSQGWHVPLAEEARLDRLLVQACELGLEQAADQAAYAALALSWPADRGAIASDEHVRRGIELACAGVPLADYLQQNPSFTSVPATIHSNHP